MRQLEKIGDYIALDSPANACQFIDKLIISVERLKKIPLSGANVPESPNLKQIVIQKYRIIYRPSDSVISIMTVLSPYQR